MRNIYGAIFKTACGKNYCIVIKANDTESAMIKAIELAKSRMCHKWQEIEIIQLTR